MVNYNVKLVSEEHELDQTIECPDNVYILDTAEEAGIDLPYSCKSGACSSCAGKIKVFLSQTIALKLFM